MTVNEFKPLPFAVCTSNNDFSTYHVRCRFATREAAEAEALGLATTWGTGVRVLENAPEQYQEQTERRQQERKSFLENLKVGDSVRLVRYWGPSAQWWTGTVERVTASSIFVRYHGQDTTEHRFVRETGQPYGNSAAATLRSINDEDFLRQQADRARKELVATLTTALPTATDEQLQQIKTILGK